MCSRTKPPRSACGNFLSFLTTARKAAFVAERLLTGVLSKKAAARGRPRNYSGKITLGRNCAMKSDFGKLGFLLAAANVAAGALLVGAVYAWAPVCTGMVQTAAGGQLPMRCFYTGHALAMFGTILLVNGAMMLFTKKLLHGGAVAIAVGIFSILVLSGSGLGIGICMKVMACHNTAAWAKLCGGLAVAAGAASLAFGMKSR